MRRIHFQIHTILIFLAVIAALVTVARIAYAPRYAEVDLMALGRFPFDQRNGSDSGIPARWRKLEGQRVALEGFMYDPYSAGTTRNFELEYNPLQDIHGPPLVQERVFATAPKGPFNSPAMK